MLTSVMNVDIYRTWFFRTKPHQWGSHKLRKHSLKLAKTVIWAKVSRSLLLFSSDQRRGCNVWMVLKAAWRSSFVFFSREWCSPFIWQLSGRCLPQNEAVGGLLSGLSSAITAPEQKAWTERSLVYFCISLLVIYDPAALRSNLAASPVED